MADIWREFRASPSSFLATQRTNVNSVTQELLEVCAIVRVVVCSGRNNTIVSIRSFSKEN